MNNTTEATITETILDLMLAESIIDIDSDYFNFKCFGSEKTFMIQAGKFWSEPDVRREVLHELFPNWNEGEGYWNEREQIDNLTKDDYLKFANQNKNRWEVEVE